MLQRPFGRGILFSEVVWEIVMGIVKRLAYVVADSGDLSAWKSYATDILGFQVARDSSNSLLYLRADDQHHRIAIRQAGSDDIAQVGWQVADMAALEKAAAAVEAEGIAVKRGTANEAADRRVLEFVHFLCPHSGIKMELVVSPEQIFTPHFRPTRDLAGFRTGALGLGHVVLYAPDVRAAANFYTKVLGFGVSDYAMIPGAGPLAVFMHCNERHHSLAFMTIPGATRKIQHIMFETLSIDDVGQSYDLCHAREITTTTPGRHHNDHTFSFYFKTPSHWHMEFGWEPRIIDPDTWTTEHYELRGGHAWGHHGIMEMI